MGFIALCRMQVACDEVQTGTRMQLLVRDPASGRQALEADLQVCKPVWLHSDCSSTLLCRLHEAVVTPHVLVPGLLST